MSIEDYDEVINLMRATPGVIEPDPGIQARG